MPLWRAMSIFAVAAIVICAGCKQSPFQPPAAQTGAPNVFVPPTPAQGQASTSQFQDLNRRVSQLDLNNADLHRQLAQADQKRQQEQQAAQEQISLLQKQLGDTASRLKDAQVARQDADK